MPVPKVIDFGIAKETQARLAEKTLFTEFRHMIGTPAYMSPEQAQVGGIDGDTRSDTWPRRYRSSLLPIILRPGYHRRRPYRR